MTELQQKDFDELIEAIASEEMHCRSCPDDSHYEACECCSVRGNLNDLERQLHDMTN